jgi:hypothetical protein
MEQYSQLELFSKVEGSRRRRSSAFFSRIWAYEKVILLVIGFLVCAAVAFSLGVEKGRHIAGIKGIPAVAKASPRPVAVKPVAAKPATLRPLASRPATTQVIARQPVQAPPVSGAYTIQLASYKSRDLAQQEADALKKKGLTPVFVSKGEYVVLCVGNFVNKETAKSLLPALEKQYRDCFIRRI